MRSRLGWLAVAALLVIGHFLPWAQHGTAALTLSGHDLAIFTNETPFAGGFANEWFYVPVWTAALLIALASPARQARDRRISRSLSDWGRGLLAALIASLGLPAYDRMRLFPAIQADYQARLVISLVVMTLCVALSVQRLASAPDWLRAAILAFNLVPLYGYSLVRWPIEQLYGDAVSFGIGWWITLATVLLGLALWSWPLLTRSRAQPPPRST